MEIDRRSNRFAVMHVLEAVVDLIERQFERDVLVDLEFASSVEINDCRQFGRT